GAANGTACNAPSDCQSTFCVDRICCDKACTGSCNTCSTTPGTCTPLAAGASSRGNGCSDMGKSSCGTDGFCDGAGACRKYGAGEICNSTPMCNAAASTVLVNQQCDGNGSCLAGTVQDCKGFRCASAVCGTSCTNDAACVSTAFC